MSGSVGITMIAGTSITAQPGNISDVIINQEFTLGSSLDATGSNVTYQWYSCTSTGASRVSLGAASSTKTKSHTQVSAGTYYYICVVSGDCGEPVETNVVTVTVAEKYLLTYDANGGLGAPGATYVAPGSTTLSSTAPTRDGYRFLGWNTENNGSGTHYDKGASYTMGTAATTLYAEWQEIATITYVLDVTKNGTTLQTISGTGSTNARITASTSTTLLAGGLGTGGKASDKGTHNGTRTLGINTLSEETSSQYFYVTFSIAENYEFVPTSITLKGITIGGNATSYKAVLTDGANEVIGTTSVTNDSEFTLGDWSGLNTTRLIGDVTLKLYGWYTTDGTYNSYRLSTPITITGDVNYICPQRPTVELVGEANRNLFVDRSTTLELDVTPYNGAKNISYQWKKDGTNIAGATSASYTVIGSGLTVGTTYKYTCDVTEEDACATVTSSAFNVKALAGSCGYTVIASA